MKDAIPANVIENKIYLIRGRKIMLNSERAIDVNIAIMRAFVRLRKVLQTHKDLAIKIKALELKFRNHDMKFSEYDKHIAAIFEAIRQLMTPSPEPPKRRIGVNTN